MRPVDELTSLVEADPNAHSPGGQWQKRFYPESCFGKFTNIDGTVLFYSRICSLLREDSVVIDYGCGRGAFVSDPIQFRRELRLLRSRVASVIGLDTDPNARLNPTLSEFRQVNSRAWPVDDVSVDLVVCDCVLEHLLQPEAFFREAARVLRQGGYLCIRTTNRWHYVGLISRGLPTRFHARVLRAAQPNREEHDVFSAVYRCNTIRQLRHQLVENGFDPAVYSHEPEPGYLAFAQWAYLLGVLYQRYAPPALRSTLVAFGQKR